MAGPISPLRESSPLTKNTALKNPVLLMKYVTFIRNCSFIALNLFHFERNVASVSRRCCQSHTEIFISDIIHRGSYMSAHVLLNLLNELGKRDKMRGLPSILSLFRNEFNKFNNTRERMLDSIYRMTLRYL